MLQEPGVNVVTSGHAICNVGRQTCWQYCQTWNLIFELSDLGSVVRTVHLGTCFKNVSLGTSRQNCQIWDVLFQVSDLETVVGSQNS